MSGFLQRTKFPGAKTSFTPNSKFHEPVATSPFGECYKTALTSAYRLNKGRRIGFFPSSLPICSILTYSKLLKAISNDGFEETKSCFTDFFAALGTAAHTVVQRHIGLTGKIFGDWQCDNRDCATKGELVKNTTNCKCPTCGIPMEYVEKRVKYKGLSGKIDALVETKKDTFWVGDYKGATTKKIEQGKAFKKYNVKQVLIYCYILTKKYGFTIEGFSLIYISRDNPNMWYEYSEKFDDENYSKAEKLFKDERKRYVAGVNAIKQDDYQIAIKEKPCTSRKFYDDQIAYFDPCPYLGVCFDKGALELQLRKERQELGLDKKRAEKYIEMVQL